MMRCTAVLVLLGLGGCFATGGNSWATQSPSSSSETSSTASPPPAASSSAAAEQVPQYRAPRRTYTGSCDARVAGAWNVLAHLPEGDVTFILELFDDGSTGHHDYVFSNGDQEGPDLNKNAADKWTTENGQVHFDFNNRYVKYSGQCPSGDEMGGDAVNVNAVTFTWEATRHR